MNLKSCALRRIEILQILCKRKKEKIENLAEELCVSKRTICNDLEALSNSFPIYTQTGTYGGIFIVDGFTLGMKYLSDKQLKLLSRLLSGLTDEEDIKILKSIIDTYKNPLNK